MRSPSLFNRKLNLIVAFVLLTLLTAAYAQPAETLLRDLQNGGYVIYFRHAATGAQSDTVNAAGDWTSCDPGRMRQLSEAGRAEARAVGNAFRALDIPVSNVAASEYCRTVETAELLKLGKVEPTTDLLNTRSASYVGGQEALITRARQRLGTVPPAGTNTVLVSHGFVISAAADISLSEGEAAVFRPLGDGQFEFVSTVSLEDWQRWVRQSGDQSGE